MLRFVDIDGTICRTKGTDYHSSVPSNRAIQRVNAWYDHGDIIVYWTSRGVSYKDKRLREACRALTTKQLMEWGCRYHELRMDKPIFDRLYDDRARTNVW